MRDAREVLSAPTLDETLDVQSDLEKLCRPGSVDRHEIYAPNIAYGHDLIIKAWAGVTADRPLKIALPHGVAYGVGFMYEPRELLPVLAYVRESEREKYRAFGVRGRLWRMALPYTYVPLLAPSEPAPHRRGTIFFPSHSTARWSVRGDFAALAASLEAIPPERQPVTVCVFHEDVDRGLHRPFLDRGLRVVSAGWARDPAFLFRLHHLCSTHEWAAANEMGSHIFYSVAAGCRWFRHGDDIDFDWPGYPYRRDPSEVEFIFGDFSGAEQTFQRSVVDEYLGTNLRLEPDELRATLERAAWVDRLSIREPNAEERMVWTAPHVARRAVRRVGRPLQKRMRTSGS